MSAPDYALSIPKIPLALQGASTDATKWFATDSPVEREGLGVDLGGRQGVEPPPFGAAPGFFQPVGRGRSGSEPALKPRTPRDGFISVRDIPKHQAARRP